jgi:hypothetical protein
MVVDLKEARMFQKSSEKALRPVSVCDAACRAAEIRDCQLTSAAQRIFRV